MPARKKRAVGKRTAHSPAVSAPAKPRRRGRGTSTSYREQLEALQRAELNVTLEFHEGPVTLTNLDKVLWPATASLPAYSRRNHMRYLLRMADRMLPHVQDRPLTLIRQPEGVTGRRFVQFHWEQSLPAFVDTVSIYSERNQVPEDYLVCNNVPTLLWLAHVGCLELHPWHSRAKPGPDAKNAGGDYASSLGSFEASALNRPDYIVLDIDPYIYSGSEREGAQPEFNIAAFEKGKELAFIVKRLLDRMGLTSLVKTSGKTGLHVLIPIARTLTYGAARAFADTLGRHVMREHSDLVTMDQKVGKRTGKIFFDANMNARVKTLAAPYSVRGIPGAPVAMPVEWSELERVTPLEFTMSNVADIVDERGDPWRDFFSEQQDIERVLAGA
jgi:bifunctional non-homologous end joining protein LigD